MVNPRSASSWYTLFEDDRSSRNSKQNFDHQVAGHVSKRLTTFLDDYVLKPRIKYDLFDNEIKFYEKQQGFKKSSSLFNRFTPQYFGVFHEFDQEGETDGSYSPYIVLNDLTSGFVKPNLIDIKMGQQTYEPTASEEKKTREILKYEHQTTVGFRITGFKVYNVVTEEYDEIDKYFGRALLPESIDYGLAYFFFNGEVFHLTVIRNALIRLKEILSYMQEQTHFHYYCSSILIVYDSSTNTQADSGCTSLESSLNRDNAEVLSKVEEAADVQCSGCSSDVVAGALEEGGYCSRSSLVSVKNSRVSVSMIDFAHTIPPPAASPPSSSQSSDQVDFGYVHGLKELIRRLTVIASVLESPDHNAVTEFRDSMLSFMNNCPQFHKKVRSE